MELHSAEQHGGSAIEALPYTFTWSIMLGRRLSPQPQGPAVACGESGPSAVPAPCTLSSTGTGTAGFYRPSRRPHASEDFLHTPLVFGCPQCF